MRSAFIRYHGSYSAMPVIQQIPAASPPSALVLRAAPLKYPTPTPDRGWNCLDVLDSSRTALMGEQPSPWR